MKLWQGTSRSGIIAVALVACLALVSCSGDNSGTGAPPATGTVSGQVTSAADGTPVAGATISTAAGSTTSAADGSFTVAAAAGARTVLQVEATGFAETFPVGRVAAGVTTALKVLLHPTGSSTPVTVATGATVTMPNSTAQVTIPPNGLVPKAGGAAAGTVTVSITPINPAVNPNVMPGGFLGVAAGGGAPALMESFGAMLIDIRDNTGARYNLAPGKTSTIRIPVGTRSANPPATSPLFFFDESTGFWKEEGTATLQGTAPNQFYEGTVTHFSFWNVDFLYPAVFVSGCLRDSQNQPVAGAIIKADGLDYSGYGAAFTEADGTFTVPLRRSGVATLSAVDFPLLSLASVAVSNVVNVGPSTVDFTLQACLVLGPTPLAITTQFMPGGVRGVAYSQILTASGGASGYIWSLNPGSSPLPAGLSLTPWGVITGTPTAVGTRLITVRVIDSSGTVVVKSLNLTINAVSSGGGGGTLNVANAPASIGGTFVVFPQATAVNVQGTITSVGWGEMISGNLAHTEGVTIAFDTTSGQVLSVLFAFADLSVGNAWGCNAALPPGCAGASVDRTAGTFTVVNTELSGNISIPPITLNGTLTFPPGMVPVTITSPSPLPVGTVGIVYSTILGASGGTPPLSWSVISGALPVGLMLDSSTGVLSGVPTTQATSTFTIRVQDSGATQQSDQKQFSLTINAFSSGGGGGTVTVANAPPSVGGTFVANPLTTTQVTTLGSELINWSEAPPQNSSYVEGVSVSFNLTTEEIDFVQFFSSQGGSSFLWICGPFIGSNVPCNGVTVNRTAGTANFASTVLTDIVNSTPPITLNGTLTLTPF